ncbi:MAG: hypothetical protein IKS83_03680, partial [Victivallales bacterium]|nr:hypothetical protein [Victivallales bacterium]
GATGATTTNSPAKMAMTTTGTETSANKNYPQPTRLSAARRQPLNPNFNKGNKMNLIRFIKQAQSLDKDGLQLLFNALSTKLEAAKPGTSEWANIYAQFNAVYDLLRQKW